ncbi:sugar ABC transporter permease [Streptomyces sp. NPDC096079]|uniref:sugar ABC transporter permease n=1 Tax=Streptomyces sp. NPDC096079 TaxID=3155820 RepID=UPI00331B5F32
MTGELDWAERASASLLHRVGAAARAAGERFPLYADPVDGRWTTTGRGSWTGGFWAGLLRLRARRTGEAADRAAAAACTARLAPWAEADTAARGLILWYGTALDDGAEARLLRERAARCVLAAYEPALGLVPWGAALGGPRLRARADGVPGLVPLLASAGAAGEAAAAGHLHRHLDLCLDGSPGERPSPSWEFAGVTGWRPCPEPEPEPGWTRGEAWLLLAVADALLRAGNAAWRPERLYEAAELLLLKGRFLHGPLVPPARARHPDGPVDTSAAAIGAVALLKLALLPGPRSAAYRTRAEDVLRHLTRTHCAEGLLWDGCYDAATDTATRHALVWGDFFLALGLGALLGDIDLTEV